MIHWGPQRVTQYRKIAAAIGKTETWSAPADLGRCQLPDEGLFARTVSKDARPLSILRCNEENAARMLGGVGRAGMVAGSSTAKIDVLGVVTFGIRREQKRFGSPKWKRHTKFDQREMTVEQYRTVDTCERSEFLGDPLCFCQKGIAKQVAKRQV